MAELTEETIGLAHVRALLSSSVDYSPPVNPLYGEPLPKTLFVSAGCSRDGVSSSEERGEVFLLRFGNLHQTNGLLLRTHGASICRKMAIAPPHQNLI